jgi:xanthosine utilization system XapX-like protein
MNQTATWREAEVWRQKASTMVIITLLKFLIGALVGLRWDIFVLVSVVGDTLAIVALIGIAGGEDASSIAVDMVVTAVCIEAGFMARLFVEMLADATRATIVKVTRALRL